jgi:O-antigen/teichoic acid export membrane protein
VKTALLLGFIQAALLVVISIPSVGPLGQLFSIPGQYQSQFEVVVLWCLFSCALGFAFNPVQQLLYANQRIDIINYIAMGAQTSGALVLVWALISGYGLFSYVFSAWVTTLTGTVLAGVWCVRLGLMPSLRGAPFHFAVIPSLTRFSANVMMIMLGQQVIAIGPAVVINRLLGVGAMGDWSVGTKILQFSQQLVSRISNAAEPALWDIYTRGEREFCRERLVQACWLASSMATVLGALLLSLNGTFVRLWSGGLVTWPMFNDLLGAAILWVTAFSATWSMLPGITKRLGRVGFVPLIEGLIFLGLLMVPALVTGLNVVLVGTLASILMARFAYGAARMMMDLGESPTSLLRLLARPALFWVAAMPVAAAIRFVLAGDASWPLFLLAGFLGCACFPAMGYWFAFTSTMRQDIKDFIRQRLRPV